MAHSDDSPPGHGEERDTLTETIRQKLEQIVPDLVKKTFAAGMGAVFSTEEGIRKFAGSARESIPEVAGYLASSADGAKDRVVEIIARETREFLSGLNLTDEIAKLLTTLSFEIKTEIRFIPNSERLAGAEPEVKASVRLKRTTAAGSDKADRAEKADRTDKADKAEKADRADRAATPGGDKTERMERVDDDTARDSRSRLRFWRRDGREAAPGVDDERDDGDNADK